VHRLVPCLVAAACAVALAGCGGDGEAPAPAPTLPRALASDLAAQSDAIAEAYAAGDVCGAAGQADVLLDAVMAAIEEGRVPGAFQESLTSTANELVNQINCPEPEPPPAEEEEEGQVGCEELVEQKDVLEEARKDAKGKGKQERLDEQIRALEQQIEACQEGGGDGEEGDD
jgi:hypothetical protein